MSATSSPLPASSPKFLALNLPHPLVSCTEKLMVSPNNTHVPFTLPAHYGKRLLLLGCEARPALRTTLVFLAASSAHIPCIHQAVVPAGSPPPNPLPTVCLAFHSHPSTFLGTQHPQTPLPNPSPAPTHPNSPLSSNPFAPPPPLPPSPLTAPPFAVRTTCP